MQSFSKLLITLAGYKFSSFQVTAAVRIKPLLGQEDVNLRRASFTLLGDLTNSLNSEANLEAFKEQIQGNLVTLMLHLCDPDMYVVKVSKTFSTGYVEYSIQDVCSRLVNILYGKLVLI